MEINDEVVYVNYFGNGITFLKQINNIIFDKYVDFNPLYPFSVIDNSIVNVFENKQTKRDSGTFTLLDDTGLSHHFNFSLITKAQLLDLNGTLMDIRNTIPHDDSKKLTIKISKRVEESNEDELQMPTTPEDIDDTEKD